MEANEAGAKSSHRHVVASALKVSPLAIGVRAIALIGSTWAVVQFCDRYELFNLPKGTEGLLKFIWAALTVVLIVEVIALSFARSIANPLEKRIATKTPEEAFASGVVEYANQLAASSPPRDNALLQLWALASVNNDLKLIQFSYNQRNETDTPAPIVSCALPVWRALRREGVARP